MSPARAIFIVWLRSVAVFRKDLWYGMITTFVEPLLYLGSFGFGLGKVIGHIQISGHDVSYRAFVLSGLIGQSVLFTAFFDAAYGGFVRMYYQKIYNAIAVTQVTFSELLWGELLWGASRAMLSTSVILIIGLAIGDFSLLGALALLPIAFTAAMFFSGLGMLVAAKSRTIESISYPQYLLIFPMFLFCGVYFPLTNLPQAVQVAAQFLPLTPLLSLSRSLLLGFDLQWWALPLLVFWVFVLVPCGRWSMRRRLIA